MIKYRWIYLVVLFAMLIVACGGSTEQPAQDVDPTTGAGVSPNQTQTPQGNLADPGIIPAITTPTSTAPGPPSTVEAPLSPVPTKVREPVNRVWGIEVASLADPLKYDLVTGSGASWVRRNAIFWSSVEPVKGARDWQTLSRLETELVNAAQQGIEVILVVRSTPRWAQAVPGLICGPILDAEIPAFADFMHEIVSRYSAPPYNVSYYEIWNEPDVLGDIRFIDPESPFGCWGDPQEEFFGGADYARILKAVYPQVKSADPDAQLLVGGLLMDCDPVSPPVLADGSNKDCSTSQYLEGILVEGGGDFFDGVSFHAYDFYAGELGKYGNSNWNSSSSLTGPTLHAKTRYLRSLLYKYGFPEKYLINSEVALICGSDGTEAVCQSEDFNLTKAYYAAIAYAGAISENLAANIWYILEGWRGSGMLDTEGNPQAVYDAFQFSGQQLRYAEYMSNITEIPGVSGYRFEDGGKEIWLLWAVETPQAIELPAQPSAVYDVFGGLRPRPQTLEITNEPIYIEWVP